jgi:hypothetical protein
MSYWFHRNPLKATARQAFDIKMFAHDHEALKICGDLKMARARLLELLPDPNHTIEQVFSFCNDGKNTFITEKIVVCSVPDPNPDLDPSDPYVFGPAGSGPISQRHGSGSFYHHVKTVRKPLVYCFVTSF